MFNTSQVKIAVFRCKSLGANAHPTDAPKRHVEKIAVGRHVYVVHQGWHHGQRQLPLTARRGDDGRPGHQAAGREARYANVRAPGRPYSVRRKSLSPLARLKCGKPMSEGNAVELATLHGHPVTQQVVIRNYPVKRGMALEDSPGVCPQIVQSILVFDIAARA
jgi:hypothetical protein